MDDLAEDPFESFLVSRLILSSYFIQYIWNLGYGPYSLQFPLTIAPMRMTSDGQNLNLEQPFSFQTLKSWGITNSLLEKRSGKRWWARANGLPTNIRWQFNAFDSNGYSVRSRSIQYLWLFRTFLKKQLY